jgi:hypothetical protein
MGMIDKSTYTLSCENCGTNETNAVLQKGSGNGGSWQSSASVSKFETLLPGGGTSDPKLDTASYKQCSSSAIVQIS